MERPLPAPGQRRRTGCGGREQLGRFPRSVYVSVEDIPFSAFPAVCLPGSCRRREQTFASPLAKKPRGLQLPLRVLPWDTGQQLSLCRGMQQKPISSRYTQPSFLLPRDQQSPRKVPFGPIPTWSFCLKKNQADARCILAGPVSARVVSLFYLLWVVNYFANRQ